MASNYTVLEMAVLVKLIASARGNGHDFGFVEDARGVCDSKKQLGGVVASLVKKGVIIVEHPVRVNGEEVTQFTWPESPDGQRLIPSLTA